MMKRNLQIITPQDRVNAAETIFTKGEQVGQFLMPEVILVLKRMRIITM